MIEFQFQGSYFLLQSEGIKKKENKCWKHWSDIFPPLKNFSHKPYSGCERRPQRSSADQIKETSTHTNIQSPFIYCSHETEKKNFSINVKWNDYFLPTFKSLNTGNMECFSGPSDPEACQQKIKLFKFICTASLAIKSLWKPRTTNTDKETLNRKKPWAGPDPKGRGTIGCSNFDINSNLLWLICNLYFRKLKHTHKKLQVQTTLSDVLIVSLLQITDAQPHVP